MPWRLGLVNGVETPCVFAFWDDYLGDYSCFGRSYSTFEGDNYVTRGGDWVSEEALVEYGGGWTNYTANPFHDESDPGYPWYQYQIQSPADTYEPYFCPPAYAAMWVNDFPPGLLDDLIASAEARHSVSVAHVWAEESRAIVNLDVGAMRFQCWLIYRIQQTGSIFDNPHNDDESWQYFWEVTRWPNPDIDGDNGFGDPAPPNPTTNIPPGLYIDQIDSDYFTTHLIDWKCANDQGYIISDFVPWVGIFRGVWTEDEIAAVHAGTYVEPDPPDLDPPDVTYWTSTTMGIQGGMATGPCGTTSTMWRTTYDNSGDEQQLTMVAQNFTEGARVEVLNYANPATLARYVGYIELNGGTLTAGVYTQNAAGVVSDHEFVTGLAYIPNSGTVGFEQDRNTVQLNSWRTGEQQLRVNGVLVIDYSLGSPLSTLDKYQGATLYWDCDEPRATYIYRLTGYIECDSSPPSDPDAPPPTGNFLDNFADAPALNFSVDGVFTGSNVGSTSDGPDDPLFGWTSYRTVWCKFTLGSTQDIHLTTLGSNFDTTLGVYTGSLGSLTEIVFNDDEEVGSGLWSEVTFTATLGVTYYVEMSGYEEFEAGNIVLNVEVL